MSVSAIRFKEVDVDSAIWPNVFLTGQLEPHPEDSSKDEQKQAALATQLLGWSNCMASNRPPENFGWGMIALEKITGVLTYDECLAAAQKLRSESTSQ